MPITVFKLQVVHSICENSEEEFQKVVLEVETYFIIVNIIQPKHHEQRIYLSFVIIFQHKGTAPAPAPVPICGINFFVLFLDYFKIN